MPRDHDDGTIAYRNKARQFMRDLRRDAQGVGRPGRITVAALVKNVASDAARAAEHWPTREGRLRFLAELAGEARSEGMVQAEHGGPEAQFYDALKDRLNEMANAERK